VLALKTECALNTLYRIYIFYHSEFWTTCACPEKQNLPWNFSLYWNIFCLSEFSSNWACPENRICPEFFKLGVGRPPNRPASYATACVSLTNKKCMKKKNGTDNRNRRGKVLKRRALRLFRGKRRALRLFRGKRRALRLFRTFRKEGLYVCSGHSEEGLYVCSGHSVQDIK